MFKIKPQSGKLSDWKGLRAFGAVVAFKIENAQFRVVSMFFHINGGETASTGIKKFGLHTKLLPACKNGGKLNIIADDYNYALAA